MQIADKTTIVPEGRAADCVAGKLRAKVHTFFETGLLGAEDKITLREEVREVILQELMKK